MKFLIIATLPLRIVSNHCFISTLSNCTRKISITPKLSDPQLFLKLRAATINDTNGRKFYTRPMKPYMEPTFTIGIEEEYLLIDPETRNLAEDPPATILEECRKRVGDQVTPEFLRSQIEVGTKICTTISEAREEHIEGGRERAEGNAMEYPPYIFFKNSRNHHIRTFDYQQKYSAFGTGCVKTICKKQKW